MNGDRWDIFWNGPALEWDVEGRNVGFKFSGALAAGWHRIVTILPSGQTQFSGGKAYVDGVLQTISNVVNGTVAPLYGSSGYNSGLLCGTGGVPVNQWLGYMDELRLSKIERSQDWITTDYNNQSNVAAFWSQTAAVGSKSRTIIIN